MSLHGAHAHAELTPTASEERKFLDLLSSRNWDGQDEEVISASPLSLEE